MESRGGPSSLAVSVMKMQVDRQPLRMQLRITEMSKWRNEQELRCRTDNQVILCSTANTVLSLSSWETTLVERHGVSVLFSANLPPPSLRTPVKSDMLGVNASREANKSFYLHALLLRSPEYLSISLPLRP